MRLRPHSLPIPAEMASWPVNPYDGSPAPSLCFEIATKNETLLKLDDRDFLRYFETASGCNVWIGVKMFIDKNGQGNHRWWCGWAYRDRNPNNTFANSGTLSPESFPQDLLLATPTAITFTIPTNLLFGNITMPANCPPNFTFPCERFRRLLMEQSVYL